MPENTQQPTNPPETPMQRGKALKASELFPQTPGGSSETPSSWSSGILRRRIFLGTMVVIIVLGLGLGGWLISRQFSSRTEQNTTQNTNTPKSTNTLSETNTAVNTPADTTPSVINYKDTDKDNDGLSDEEENQLGLNPDRADTDDDDLSDYKEVRVYKTDGQKPDTDSDGYTDGEEVNKGYNPNGTGILRDINAALQNTQP